MTADIFDPFCDPSKIALTLSQHLVSRGKKKALMNMTSGLEMLALALTICREVRAFQLLAVIQHLFFVQE
jgi:hypothetical protein